jgi:predicted dehydrogenase
VRGVYDINPEATAGLQAAFAVERVFESVDALLADPEIEVVDIATFPAERLGLIRRALAAEKHVLSQKPLALETRAARDLVEEAERRGVLLAVNQNGRWAPPWRVATLLIEQGAIGDVLAVTHLYDRNFRFVLGRPYDEIEHFVLYDYSVHWIDITRCWLSAKRPTEVRALDYRTPNQPADGKTPWGAWAVFDYADGSSATIRAVGGSETSSPASLFWIHGTDGTIRGQIGDGGTSGRDSIELERHGIYSRYPLVGRWFYDGFAATMAELLSAIAERREPYNSARHNLLSLEMTLAACRSAEAGGAPVAVGRPEQP